MSWDRPSAWPPRGDPRPPVTHDGRPLGPPRAPTGPPRSAAPAPSPRVPGSGWTPAPTPAAPPAQASRAFAWAVATWVLVGTALAAVAAGLGPVLAPLLLAAFGTGITGGVLGLRDRRLGVLRAGRHSALSFLGAGAGLLGLVVVVLLLLLVGWLLACLASFGAAC